jgi:drug/metabolite transporter (DMT)-like permease
MAARTLAPLAPQLTATHTVEPPAPPGKGDEPSAIVAVMVTVGLWASAFVGVRSAGHSLSPGSLALGRLLVGSAVLGLFVLVRSERPPAARDLPAIAFCGVLWFGFYNVALNAGERHVDAGTAAMLVNLGPVLIALLAGVVLREGFPRSLFTGCAIAFAGTVIIGLATARGTGATAGVLLCLAAALAYAGAVVMQKPLLTRASALQVTWLACTVGALACLPFLPALVHELGRARGSAIAWTAYLGALPTAVAFTTWAYALGRTTAGRMGATTYLVPSLAVLLSWALLGETPPVLALAGGVLCVIGVGVTRRAA